VQELFNYCAHSIVICRLILQLMAMIGELFAGFDSLKALVEKISEAFEKMSDEKDVMVC